MRVTARDPANLRLVAGDWVSVNGPVVGLTRCIQVEGVRTTCQAGATIWRGAILHEAPTITVYISESASTTYAFYLANDGRLHSFVPAGGRPANVRWVFERIPP